MKSPLSSMTLVVVLALPALYSCNRQAQTISDSNAHYNSDTYYIAGGFDAEEEQAKMGSSPLGTSLAGSYARNSRDDRYRTDRGGGWNADGNDADRLDDPDRDQNWSATGSLWDDDQGMSIADYRRAYRRGYRDGQWDANSLPGLYSPNYGGWGWGIGPGIGWNAPCWSWGGGWNYYASWNNPWNGWNNPWGNGWGWGGWSGWGGGFGWGGWNSWGYGGWNHWGGWNRWGWGGWNGWGGNTYVWIHNQPRYRSGPRRDRLNQIDARSGSANRMTPWGQARANGTARRHGDFVSRVSAMNNSPRNAAGDAAVAQAGSGEQRGRRLFSLPYAQDRAVRREGAEPRNLRGRAYGGNPSGTTSERTYSYRDRLSGAVTGRGTYGDKGPERTYGNDKVRGGTWSDRSFRSEYRSPRTESSTPRSSYSTPRSSYSTPRSSYSTPRSSYTSPRSSYSIPRSSYSSPRSSSGSTYSAPRSSYSSPRSSYSSPRSSSGSTYSAPRSSSGSSSGSVRSGSFSPRR